MATVQGPERIHYKPTMITVPLNVSNNPAEEATQTRAVFRNKRCMNVCFYISFIVFGFIVLVGMLVSLHLLFTNFYLNSNIRYLRMRQHLLERERVRRIGGKLVLGPEEQIANEQLLAIKQIDEEDNSLLKPYFLSKYNINETHLYGALHSMPKGGLLHVHDSGMFKRELLVELCRYADLWVCIDVDGELQSFRFARVEPQSVHAQEYACGWRSMKDYWLTNGEKKTDDALREVLTLKEHAGDTTKRLRRMQRLVFGLITYRPVWTNYIFRMLEDFYDDGVTYVELRSSLPILYDLDRSNYSIVETACAIKTVSTIFQKNNCKFIGTKLIYAPMRESNSTNIEAYLINSLLLKEKFPGFFVGLDLMNLGNECQTHILKDNTVQLLRISNEIDFYFHAGESSCYKSNATDENLIDAILLGTKRVGNTLALPRHPEVLRILRTLSIAMELCPLADHYLNYIDDFKMHPAAYFIAAGYPVVIGSDYPHYWNARPLTDDFYIAFVGIASSHGNLAMLKQLALNSLLYSAMSGSEKAQAIQKWLLNWHKWVEEFNKRIL